MWLVAPQPTITIIPFGAFMEMRRSSAGYVTSMWSPFPLTIGGAMAVACRLPELLRRSAATVATLIAGLCCWPAPSEAYIEHPWCTRTGTTSCSFDSYEQCMENARLLTQTNCVANPWIHPLPQAPPHHARGVAARRR